MLAAVAIGDWHIRQRGLVSWSAVIARSLKRGWDGGREWLLLVALLNLSLLSSSFTTTITAPATGGGGRGAIGGYNDGSTMTADVGTMTDVGVTCQLPAQRAHARSPNLNFARTVVSVFLSLSLASFRHGPDQTSLAACLAVGREQDDRFECGWALAGRPVGVRRATV
jgi:hypothetical protein